MKALVIGKGKSYPLWEKVGYFVDAIYCLNSVIEVVKHGTLVQRDPGHVFNVPARCEVFAPIETIEPYLVRGDLACTAYGWAYIPKCCAACTAIRLADIRCADTIYMAGFDNLWGDNTYHPQFQPAAGKKQIDWGLAQQFDQFRALHPIILDKCVVIKPDGDIKLGTLL